MNVMKAIILQVKTAHTLNTIYTYLRGLGLPKVIIGQEPPLLIPLHNQKWHLPPTFRGALSPIRLLGDDIFPHNIFL